MGACRPHELLRDIGSTCAKSVKALENVLLPFPTLDEAEVARMLAMMAQTQGLWALCEPCALSSARSCLAPHRVSYFAPPGRYHR